MRSSSSLLHGMRDGLPIGLGYFAVAFSLGITARNAGITAIQGYIVSMLNNASAGEYAAIAAIKDNAPYIELAVLILITNARYLLMSAALSQRLKPDLPWYHRMLIGFDITDEQFAIGVAHPYPLPPQYLYGSYILTIPMWAGGTAVGIVAGNLLPTIVVTALSAAIYGMFIAVIVPPAKKSRPIMVIILISFAVSGLFALIPAFSGLSESMRIIILTVVIAVAAAIIRPVKEEEYQ